MPIQKFAATMAQVYLEREQVSGMRTAALHGLEQVVKSRLKELGFAETDPATVASAIDALVGNQVEGWPPSNYQHVSIKGEEIEYLLYLFKNTWRQKTKALAVAHAINQVVAGKL